MDQVINLFSGIPATLRDELVAEYNKIIRNYKENRWEPTELDGGRLCEIVFSVIKGIIDGKYPLKAYKPRNFLEACQKFEKEDSNKFSRSIRIHIPRQLIALYEVRNNRGVGHVGGDVNPNHMDATLVLSLSKWLVTELIRILHDLSPEKASEAIDAIVEREIPLVWKIDGKMRVLDVTLSMRDQTLLLLYQGMNGLDEGLLFKWTEHTNKSIYRRDVLGKLHAARLIEFDQQKALAKISPLGIKYVEEKLLK